MVDCIICKEEINDEELCGKDGQDRFIHIECLNKFVIHKCKFAQELSKKVPEVQELQKSVFKELWQVERNFNVRQITTAKNIELIATNLSKDISYYIVDMHNAVLQNELIRVESIKMLRNSIMFEHCSRMIVHEGMCLTSWNKIKDDYKGTKPAKVSKQLCHSCKWIKAEFGKLGIDKNE